MSGCRWNDEPRLVAAERVWRSNRCIQDSSIAGYRYWILRFIAYCKASRRLELDELTLGGTTRFVQWWRSSASPRAGRIEHAFLSARSALRAWAFARKTLGDSVPAWTTPPSVPPLPVVLQDFSRYLREVRGNPPTTIHKKLAHVAMFNARQERSEGRHRLPRLQDIDAFVIECRSRYARTTVADICSTLRGYLRFLRVTGRMHNDLAKSVMAPVVRTGERPHRTIPWEDVQRILRAVDRTSPCGLRDYALLLMMSAYGLGAGEVIGLRLDDIDWQAATLRVVRPKTRVEFMLPLLPPVARALVAYLKRGRPAHATTRHLFVTMRTPHKQLACSVTVRHILHSAARRAGVTAPFPGTHVLRHTHACRQLELGAAPKVIGDILGHRDPESTSAYLRVATARLRELSLAVPT